MSYNKCAYMRLFCLLYQIDVQQDLFREHFICIMYFMLAVKVTTLMLKLTHMLPEFKPSVAGKGFEYTNNSFHIFICSLEF